MFTSDLTSQAPDRQDCADRSSTCSGTIVVSLRYYPTEQSAGDDSLQTSGQMTSPREATTRPDTLHISGNVKNLAPSPHPSEAHLTRTDSFAHTRPGRFISEPCVNKQEAATEKSKITNSEHILQSLFHQNRTERYSSAQIQLKFNLRRS